MDGGCGHGPWPCLGSERGCPEHPFPSQPPQGPNTTKLGMSSGEWTGCTGGLMQTSSHLDVKNQQVGQGGKRERVEPWGKALPSQAALLSICAPMPGPATTGLALHLPEGHITVIRQKAVYSDWFLSLGLML